MADSISDELLGTGGLPRTMRARDTLALVWAQDGDQAEIAIDALLHALWPFYYLFHITEVRVLTLGGACPLRDGIAPVLSAKVTARFAWVLVPPGTAVEAVASNPYQN